MAYKSDRGGVGRAGGTVRCVLILVILMLFCYIVRPPYLRGASDPSILASCPPCVCDCSSDSDSILAMPFDGFNDSFPDCGKHDPDMSEELKKDVVALLSEEVTLQKNVIGDSLEHTEDLITSSKRVSSHYQNEAEKCNAGMEACEEARERAEQKLGKERKLSAVWEARAREYGWDT